MAFTRQRREILNIISNSCKHLTAEQVYRLAQTEGSRPALGTVYRNLNLLAEQGLIRRLCISGQPDRFDRNTAPHEHIICTVCGHICDISIPGFKPCLPRTEWAVTGFELTLSGICPECRKHGKEIRNTDPYIKNQT